MKTRILLVAAMLAATTSLHATSVSLSNAPLGRSATDAEGTALANGSLVLIGTFSNISALAALPPVDLASAAGWTPFGNALGVGTVFGNPGKLVGTSTDTTIGADVFDGLAIYLWVFNGASVETSTQYGIYAATAGAPPWIFPANNNGIGDLITVSVDDLSLTAVAGFGSVDGSHLQLTPFTAVPEPAAYGVAVVGMLGLAAALRRRVPRR
jgi:hypothetical protein